MRKLITAITLILLSFISSAQLLANDSLPLLPAITLNMADGSCVHTQDLLVQPYVLHFWATWCPYYKKLQPALEKIKHKGLKIIAVSFEENDDATPAKVISDRGYTFKTAIKADAIAKQLGIRDTPTTLFINKAGRIIYLTNTSNPEDENLHVYARTLLHEVSS